MFGGEGIRIINGQFNYGNFEKTFYYSAGAETVVDIGTDAPAPKSEIYNKMSPTHFDSLGGHSMIVHSQGFYIKCYITTQFLNTSLYW